MMHVHDQLACYRDLSPDDRRRVDDHLATCAECRATLSVYRRQDAALLALREIRPRRSLRPARLLIPRSAVARLGDALALGGLAALLWLFALQVQVVSQGGGVLAPAALEPGITLPPTRLLSPTPWLPALPWLAGALLSVGVLFIFTRKSLVPTAIGAVVAGLLLITFVPPFSSLPNPAGLYWRAVGGYGYDPRLPFKNSFLIAGDPAATLTPYLDQLIGERGLSPLDPNQPLARYEILQVSLHPRFNRVALVTTRFIYADGSSRVYPVPLFSPVIDFEGFWLAGWREDGLQRLRSEHLAFPEQPFATESSSIRFGAVRRLDLHPQTHRLDEANPAHWLWASVRVDRLSVAPDGSAFLVAIEQDSGLRQLWLAPLNGEPPVAIGAVGDIREYGFSPDSRYIVYTRYDPEAAAAAGPTHPYAIVAVPREATASASRIEERYLNPGNLVTGLSSDQLPGLTQEGVWFFADNTLWRAPYDGGAPAIIATDVTSSFAPRPAPDGERVAYNCLGILCLADTQGGEPLRVEGLRPVEIAWSADGARLAVIDRDPNNLRAVRLWVIARTGEVLFNLAIAPRDVTDPPQWTPDGSAIFVQTFPQDGRRIIAVDVARQQVMDLSQEHWDAYFSLMPDGRSLLLNNGRGDFWEVEVING